MTTTPHSSTTPRTDHDHTTTELALRLNVSTQTLQEWSRQPDFPLGGKIIDGGMALWNSTKIIEWLRNKPLNSRGRPVRWSSAVDHPALKEIKAQGRRKPRTTHTRRK